MSGANPRDWSDGELDDDHYFATRRAIVRAAAAVEIHSARKRTNRSTNLGEQQ